jgi:hypothetical protein
LRIAMDVKLSSAFSRCASSATQMAQSMRPSSAPSLRIVSYVVSSTSNLYWLATVPPPRRPLPRGAAPAVARAKAGDASADGAETSERKQRC